MTGGSRFVARFSRGVSIASSANAQRQPAIRRAICSSRHATAAAADLKMAYSGMCQRGRGRMLWPTSSFARWGKLEAQGNARLLPATNASIIEGRAWRRLATREPVGICPCSGDRRRSLEHHHGGHCTSVSTTGCGHLPDQGRFQRRSLAEISNPTDVTVHLSLAVTVDSKRLTRIVPVEQLPPPRHYSITVPPGFSRHEIPVKDLADILVSGLPFNLAIVPVGDATPHLLFHTLELVSFGGAVQDNSGPAKTSSAAPGVKCVVFDLDNTLWNGVLLEGTGAAQAGHAVSFSRPSTSAAS